MLFRCCSAVSLRCLESVTSEVGAFYRRGFEAKGQQKSLQRPHCLTTGPHGLLHREILGKDASARHQTAAIQVRANEADRSLRLKWVWSWSSQVLVILQQNLCANVLLLTPCRNFCAL